MAKITIDGTVPATTLGELPRIGSTAKDFTLTDSEMKEKHLSDFGKKKKILNIVASLDTGICASSARKFNESAGSRDDVAVLVISADLPFAQGRFCSAEGLKNVHTLSTFRSSFPDDYGLRIIDGPFKSLCSRSVIILDENNKVIYTQQVPKIAQEPDYKAAMAAL